MGRYRPSRHDLDRKRRVTAHQQASIDEIQLGQTVLRRGECRTNYAIINDLARRLGVKNMFPPESDEPFFDFMLEKTGLTWKTLKERGGHVFPEVFKKYEKSGFSTPSRKVELANSLMANLGMDPLPGYREPDESPLSTPELAREVSAHHHDRVAGLPCTAIRKGATSPSCAT